MPYKYRTIQEVKDNFTIDTNTNCHYWNGRYVTKDGYSEIRWRGKSILLHRLIWEFAHGQPPTNSYIKHTCKNKSCCNIDHLVLHHFAKVTAPAPVVTNPVPVNSVIEQLQSITIDFNGVKITLNR